MKKRNGPGAAASAQRLLPFSWRAFGTAERGGPVVAGGIADPPPKPVNTDDLEDPSHGCKAEELGECQWSRSVALDPRHRPQVWSEPSSTVRREWCRYPQEAHILDLERWRYRRLTAAEMAILQGFSPDWFAVPTVSQRNRIRAIGDAVPRPLATAVVAEINAVWRWHKRTALEICAGAGGLASGTASIDGMDHLALIDNWHPACEILRHNKPWPAERVIHANVREYDFTAFKGKVGLLSGGPPCQPWSFGGQRNGAADPRDLLSGVHEIVAVIEPEVFLFENVPGLACEQHFAYFRTVLERLRGPSDSSPPYGVMAGILNAADYGVPQIRRRVFILGFRGVASSLAYHVFDRIAARATHRDPAEPHPMRARWVTVAEAFRGLPDLGGWRKWVGMAYDG